MEPELADMLQNASREQLLTIVEELVTRNPAFQADIPDILYFSTAYPFDDAESFDVSTLELYRPFDLSSHQSSTTELSAYARRISEYHIYLLDGLPPQAVFNDLVAVLLDAEYEADTYEYHNALQIYALVISQRLTLQHPILIPIFDRCIDEFMPVLDMLLSEVSNNDASLSSPSHEDDTPTLLSTDPLLPDTLSAADHMPSPPTDSQPAPLRLSLSARQHWLNLLFKLWLERMALRQQDDNLPTIIFDVACHEDIPFLQDLVQQARLAPSSYPHTNIVDISFQARARTLEKFRQDLLKL